MSKFIKNIVPQAKIEGNSTPPRSGAFEVILNDKLVYSRLKTGDFPQESEIRSWF